MVEAQAPVLHFQGGQMGDRHRLTLRVLMQFLNHDGDDVHVGELVATQDFFHKCMEVKEVEAQTDHDYLQLDHGQYYRHHPQCNCVLGEAALHRSELVLRIQAFLFLKRVLSLCDVFFKFGL